MFSGTVHPPHVLIEPVQTYPMTRSNDLFAIFGVWFRSLDNSKQAWIVVTFTCPCNLWVFPVVLSKKENNPSGGWWQWPDLVEELSPLVAHSSFVMFTSGFVILFLWPSIVQKWTLKVVVTRFWFIPASNIEMAWFCSSGDTLGMVIQKDFTAPNKTIVFFFLQERIWRDSQKIPSKSAWQQLRNEENTVSNIFRKCSHCELFSDF